MEEGVSKRMSFEGWKLWEFIKGRKKLIVTIIGLVCIQFAFDPELTGLLAGGAIFEGIWAVTEYYFKTIEK